MKLKPVCGPCIQRHLRDFELSVVDKAFEACTICHQIQWVVIIRS